MDVENERKRKHSNADIFPEKPTMRLQRNTTDWRNKHGKTKKARAMNMQPSVASLFRKVNTLVFDGRPDLNVRLIKDASTVKRARLSSPDANSDIMVSICLSEILTDRHALVRSFNHSHHNP